MMIEVEGGEGPRNHLGQPRRQSFLSEKRYHGRGGVGCMSR